MEDLFLPSRFLEVKDWCLEELKILTESDKAYLLEIKKRGVKVTNTCDSAVAYCLGLTDDKPERGCDKVSGELPDI